MAVKLTLADAIVAARIAADADSIPPQISAAANVLYGAAAAQIERYAPSAPSAAQDAALVRMLAYLWELPAADSARGYQSALRNSGAIGLLSAYRVKRAGIINPEGSGFAPVTPVPGGLTPGDLAEIDKRIANAIAAAMAGDARRLPELPAEGDRNLKVAQFDQDTLLWRLADFKGLSEEQALALEALAQPPVEHTFADVSGVRGAPTLTAESLDLEQGNYLLDFIASSSRNPGPRVDLVDGSTVIARFDSIDSREQHRTRFISVPSTLSGLKLRYSWRSNNSTTVMDATLTVFRLTRADTADDAVARAAAAAAQSTADTAQASAADNRQVLGRAIEATQRLHSIPGTPTVVTSLIEASMLVHTDPPPTNRNGVASMDQPDGGWNENARIFVRLRDTEVRTNYAVRFTAAGGTQPFDVPGGQWRPRSSLSAENYTFWEAWGKNISTEVARVQLLTNLGDTLYDGKLADGIILDSNLPDHAQRAVQHFEDGLHVGPFNENYKAAWSDNRRGKNAVNNLLYSPISNAHFPDTQTTLYCYFRVPAAKRSAGFEQDASIVVYRRDSGKVLLSQPVRASEADPDPRAWQTDATVLAKYTTLFGFDYWEVSVSGKAESGQEIPLGAYFGRYERITGGELPTDRLLPKNPTDGQIAVYDGSADAWVAADAGGGGGWMEIFPWHDFQYEGDNKYLALSTAQRDACAAFLVKPGAKRLMLVNQYISGGSVAAELRDQSTVAGLASLNGNYFASLGLVNRGSFGFWFRTELLTTWDGSGSPRDGSVWRLTFYENDEADAVKWASGFRLLGALL